MTGWQVQEMWEAEAARIWEELNAPDPGEKAMKEAGKSIKEALDKIDPGLDCIAEAVASLDGFQMADKVQSFLEAFENLANELETLGEKYERGERE